MPVDDRPTFWDPYYVTGEFRLLNITGIVLYVFLMLVSLGHCVKPFRCFTKIFGSLIWFLIFIFFVCANVYRFRNPGRACSLDFVADPNAALDDRHRWFEQGRFQKRILIAYYVLGFFFAIVGCLAACCCRKKKQTMY